VYNLIRAVAPPYPGAFTDIDTGHGSERFVVARARLAPPSTAAGNLPAGLHVSDNALFAVCGDGRAIAIHELRHQPGGRSDAERAVTPADFTRLTQPSRN
jgi:methionyl-tRNA formyltransferase